MISSKSIRAGILIAIATAGTLSCGESEFTQPNPKSDIVAVRTSEKFLNSPGEESRELLIDGRVTDIEWNVTGDPSIVLMEGVSGEGASYYVSVRSMWTLDEFGAPDGIFFLLQWPDLTEDRFEEPLVTNVDVVSPTDTLDCATDNRLVREESWRRSDLQEDELTIELFSDDLGSYPKDVWRWGASTTDFASPVNPTEWQGAEQDGDAFGANLHPSASTMVDSYDTGGGAVTDTDSLPFVPNHALGSSVPAKITDKGTRDSRLNRGKPVEYVVWNSVSKVLARCETLNPIRLDDASQFEKSWNPGDYVPSYRLRVATGSQSDVLAKASYIGGKWALEVRRDLITRPDDEDGDGVPDPPRPDDVHLEPGRRYVMRVTIMEGRTKAVSRSGLVPIYLDPTAP
ncbi:MAG TPA: hypothetical protein VFP58_12920 [Candidatus Eisenbacteria bacterium]|nr:hypothetical protein [Candidatus Eisenbacteria bacterium]